MRHLLFAVLLSVVAGVQASPPKPLLWRISDADNSVYLLGSMHRLKASDYPLDIAVDKAFDEAEAIYFEVSPDEMNDPDLSRKMSSLGMLDGGNPLKRRLKSETWELLVEYCAKNRIPVESFQYFKPWLVSLMISSFEAQKAGLSGELGLDKYFMELAAKQEKKTGSFETVAEQIAFFDLLSAESQEQFLYETLKDAGNPFNFERMHALWRSGDAEGLWKLINEERKQFPKFFQEFIDDRNHAWLPEICDFLEHNARQDTLVVVGSAHLLGSEGLIELLKKKGYRVERFSGPTRR